MADVEFDAEQAKVSQRRDTHGAAHYVAIFNDMVGVGRTESEAKVSLKKNWACREKLDRSWKPDADARGGHSPD